MKESFIDRSNMGLEKRFSLVKNTMVSSNMGQEMGMEHLNGKVIDTLSNSINNSD